MTYPSTYRGDGERPSNGDSARYFYRRRRTRKQSEACCSFDEAFSRNSLFGAMCHVKYHGGAAAGVDGVSPRSLSNPEMGHFSDAASRSIRAGEFRCSPLRRSPINKPTNPHEQRWLSIPVVVDRAVATALHRLLSPRFERVFADNVHGFRPGRSPATLLADYLRVAESKKRWRVVTTDIRKAFDSVRISDVLAAFELAFQDRELLKFSRPDTKRVLWLIEEVLKAGRHGAEVGVPQGSPFSPLALNVLLHFRLDLSLRGRYGGNWFRFADNLVYAADSFAAGQSFLGLAKRLLSKISLTIKDKETSIAHTRRDTVRILGFNLRREKNHQLTISVANSAFSDLETDLQLAHDHERPRQNAKNILLGWSNSWSTSLESVDYMVHRLFSLLARTGFPRLLEAGELETRVLAAASRWQKRLRAQKPVQQEAARQAAPPLPVPDGEDPF